MTQVRAFTQLQIYSVTSEITEGLMHFRFKPAIVLTAIVLFCGGCGPTAHQRSTDPLFTHARELEDSGKKESALNEYRDVAKANASKPELAAKALLEGGLFASERFGATEQESRQGLKEAAAMWEELLKSYPKTEPADQLRKPYSKGERLMVDVYTKLSHAETVNRDAAADALYKAGQFGVDQFGKTPDEKAEAELAGAQLWKQLDQDYPDTPAGKRLFQPADGAPKGPLPAVIARVDNRNSKDFKYGLLSTLVKLTGSKPSFSYWFALFILAIIVKVLTFPLTKKQYSGMRDMQRVQPHVKALQEKGKKAGWTQVEINQKTMELYKEHNVNMFGGCLPMLVQMPFLFFIFAAIREYEFAFANGHFLWVGSPISFQGARIMGHTVFGRNLGEPDIPLLALYAITMYITTRMTPATDPQQAQQQKTMALMMSGMFFFMFLSYRWSSAFVLYWLVQNLLSIWQQYEYIYKPHKVKMAAQTAGGGTIPDVSTSSSNGKGEAPIEVKPVGGSAAPARVKPRKKGKR